MRAHQQPLHRHWGAAMHRPIMRQALSTDQSSPDSRAATAPPKSSIPNDSIAVSSPSTSSTPPTSLSTAAVATTQRGKATMSAWRSARPTRASRHAFSSARTDTAAGVSGTSVWQLPGRVMTATPWSALPGAMIIATFLLMTLAQLIHAMQARRHYRRRIAAQRAELTRAAQKGIVSAGASMASRSSRGRPPPLNLAQSSSPVLDVPIPRCKISLDVHKGNHYSFADESPFRLSEARPRESIVVAQDDFGDSYRRSRPGSGFSTRLSAFFPALPSPRKTFGRPSRLRFDMLDDLAPSPVSGPEKSPLSPTSPVRALKSPFSDASMMRSGWASDSSPTSISPVSEFTFDPPPSLLKPPDRGRTNKNATSPLTLTTINLQRRETIQAPAALLARTPSGKMIPGSQFPGLQRQNTMMRSPIGGTMASGGTRDSSFHPSPVDT